MKHQVLSSDALSKFVVLASASRGTNAPSRNMQLTASAFTEVAGLGRSIKGMELVTGFYAEQGQDGAFEQSMAIAVDSPVALKALVRLFCGKYEQECLLVWNKDTNWVTLMNERGFVADLGNNGLHMTEASLEVARLRNRVLPDAFTVAANGSIWEVR